MRWYHFNSDDKCWQESPNLPVINRAFLYGDGFFDTMLLIQGAPCFWDYHKARIQTTLSYLSLELQTDLDQMIRKLHRIINFVQPGDGRLRLSFYRDGEGKYMPESNRAECVAIIEPHETEVFPSSPLQKLGISELTLPSGEFGNHKTIGKHLQIKVALESQNESFDDLVLFNEQSHVVETISSNIFLVKEGRVYTPPLRSGALAGVVRQVLIDNIAVECNEDLTSDDLYSATEIFTTNSIIGIKSWYVRDECEMTQAKRELETVRALQLNSVRDFQGS